MSVPRAAPEGHDKIAIPRLVREKTANNGFVEKPRASRACVGCRQLKMRCSGESPCQRCTAGKRSCVFPQARKGRLRSVAEQNEHMLKLMKQLKERVSGEDKQQIEELLERIGDDEKSRHKSQDKSAYSPVAQAGDKTRVVVQADSQGLISANGIVPDCEFEGKVSNLRWLLSDAQCEDRPVGESSPKSLITESATSNEEPAAPASTRQMKSLLLNDSTLFEIFWHLQREPTEKAQMFLKYVKSCEHLNVSTVEDWLRDRQNYRSQSTSSPIPHTRTSSITSTDDRSKTFQSNTDATMLEMTDIAFFTTPAAPPLKVPTHGPHVTIGIVKRAVDMFFLSTGMMFYIVPREQLDEILDSLLLPDTAPFTAILKSSTTLQSKARLAELCGMAAVGLLYLRIADEEKAPPARLAHYFYSITKQMLDSAIEANPLRAMKVCALLTLYNIYVKASVALAYVELGTGLAQFYKLHERSHLGTGTEEILDYKRTWRTLLTFNGWLAASLGYASGQATPSFSMLEMELVREEDVLQQELVKVTIIKAKIIRAIPDDGAVEDSVIDKFRQELNDIKEELPEWMTMASLISGQQATPLRRTVMYFHLFYLSAMQLLYRRVMANPVHLGERVNVKTGVRDDLMAAKMVARMLALMTQEGYIGQFCWMCIYSSYTSGIIILQAAVQKILTGYHSSTWIADLTLANICIDVLQFCAKIDTVAARMGDIVQRYMIAIQNTVKTEFSAPPEENNVVEDEIVAYLFTIASGETNLHKAARDLLRLVQHPFGISLEMIPEGGPQPPLRNSQVNWMEAAVGVPQEWEWELQKCGLKLDKKERSDSPMRDVMSSLGAGHFIPMGDASPWTPWTAHSF